MFFGRITLLALSTCLRELLCGSVQLFHLPFVSLTPAHHIRIHLTSSHNLCPDTQFVKKQ